jgi:F-type H+-transporting ATPase subunit gamma
MPNLKDLKNRIDSVTSTRKITKAMQMVAAAKLRRAQESAEAGRPYAERFNAVMAGLSASAKASGDNPEYWQGDRKNGVHGRRPTASDETPSVRRLAAAVKLSAMRENMPDGQ